MSPAKARGTAAADPVPAPASTLTVEASDLKAAATWVARSLPLRPHVPILAGVILTRTVEGLVLSSFDFETHATIRIPADGELEGPVLVHGRMLSDAAAHLSGTVELTAQGGMLTAVAGRQRFRFNLMDLEAYPGVPALPEPSGTIEADELHELLSRAAVTTAPMPDAGVPVHAIHLEATGGELIARSTDKYRAALVRAPWQGQDFTALAPAAPVAAAARGMAGPVEIGATSAHLALSSSDRTVVVGLSGSAPMPIARLFEAPTQGRVVVDRADLIEAVAANRISLDRGQPLVLGISGSCIEVSGAGDSAGSEAVIDATGDLDLTWLVNPGYLADLLGALPGDLVALEASARKPETLPLLLAGATADGELITSATYLLVPIRHAGGAR